MGAEELPGTATTGGAIDAAEGWSSAGCCATTGRLCALLGEDWIALSDPTAGADAGLALEA